jgi:hypothetical protein
MVAMVPLTNYLGITLLSALQQEEEYEGFATKFSCDAKR